MSKITVTLKNISAPSMARAIRSKCMECGDGTANDIRDCAITHCPLWPYRFGANPKAAANKLRPYYTVEFIK